MAQYTPTQIAQEVKNQGGSNGQAWVAAALTDNIESSGSTTAKNPNSTACGLFQFLTTTWDSYGGSKYAPTACDATMQQQVSVFLTATQGGNYHDWAPDFGSSYSNPAAVTSPLSGSLVSNAVASLAAGGLTKILGPVPTNWAGSRGTAPADAGGVTPGLAGGPAPTAKVGCGKKGCLLGISFGILGKPCFLSWCQAKAIISAAEIATGGVIFVFGVVMLAGYGYDHSGAKQAVNSTTRRIGVGTALLAGQPEAAGAIELASKRGGSRGRGQGTTSRRAPRTDGSGSSTRQGKELLPNWAMPSGKPRTVGLGAGATGRPAPYSRRREQQLEGQAAEGRSPQAKRDTATLRRQVNARNTVSGPSTVAGRSRGQARERTQRRSVHYNEEGVPF